MKQYTKRENTNRGYLRLEVWNDAMVLNQMVRSLPGHTGTGTRRGRLSRQLLDSAVSIPANIAEGYCRRNVGEYLYFLNVSLGALGGLMTRLVALREDGAIDQKTFDEVDDQLSKVENEILSLIRTLEAKRRDEGWEENLREPREPYIH